MILHLLASSREEKRGGVRGIDSGLREEKELKWLFGKKNINNTQTVMNLTVTFCEVSLDYHTHFL